MHIKYFASSYYVISCFLCSNLNNFPNLHRSTHRDEFGTQRVYKKTSPNCVLTLYLPTREITLTGNNPSVLRGIVYVDPKAIQGYRVYAQLTLTFRWVYALFSFLVMVKPLMVLACSNFFFRFFHFYFRYGREDEEVMGLRFCNEAIMSLHQIWPRLEEPTPESLSPLQVILWNYAWGVPGISGSKSFVLLALTLLCANMTGPWPTVEGWAVQLWH